MASLSEIQSEADRITSLLSTIQSHWDGKEAILALQRADYNWRQMEWIGWFFEHRCREVLSVDFQVPGDQFVNADLGKRVEFDSKGLINWDFKSHPVNGSSNTATLNDTMATDWALRQDGYYGLIVAMLHVEYDDDERSFYNWHESLKGKQSAYVLEGKKTGRPSRRRKSGARLESIQCCVFDAAHIQQLPQTQKGWRNSNGRPRPAKYAARELDLARRVISEVSF